MGIAFFLFLGALMPPFLVLSQVLKENLREKTPLQEEESLLPRLDGNAPDEVWPLALKEAAQVMGLDWTGEHQEGASWHQSRSKERGFGPGNPGP